MAAGGEVGGGGEVGAVAGGRGGAGEPDREHRFADAGRPDEQHVGSGLEVGAGGELGYEVAVQAWCGVVVELGEGRRGG